MRLESLRWPQVRDLDMERVVFVVPLGSFEQHGPHLPVSTDAQVVDALVARVEALLPETVVMVPTLWIGHSPHHRHFPGTVSLDARPYADVLKAVARSLITAGAHRICLANGHGGNLMPAQLALRELKTEYGDRRDLLIAVANTYEFGRELRQRVREDSKIMSGGHAHDIETSMMLAHRPAWVKQDEGRPDGAGNDPAFDWHAHRLQYPVHVSYDMRDATATGVMGNPVPATAEKGEAVFDATVKDMAAFLQDFVTWETSPSLATPMAR
ncbi:MAG: creatininase family protein [Chloroflexi bacterium]|nr:creatininase family protein [Chloroflexota bacterium]